MRDKTVLKLARKLLDHAGDCLTECAAWLSGPDGEFTPEELSVLLVSKVVRDSYGVGHEDVYLDELHAASVDRLPPKEWALLKFTVLKLHEAGCWK